MKACFASEMRGVDKAASEIGGIPSIVLMENAAMACVEELKNDFANLSEKSVAVFCGKGNNGGDGSVIARLAAADDMKVTLVLVEGRPVTHDALLNFELIEYLIEYCISRGTKSFHYIDKVALAWAEEGITNAGQAKERQSQYSQKYYSVLNAFGIRDRGPGKPEVQMIDHWFDDLHFTSDIILRDEMFEHMQTLPIRYFDTHTHGDIMSHYTNDTDTLRQMLAQSIPQMFSSLITIISVFFAMLFTSWQRRAAGSFGDGRSI